MPHPMVLFEIFIHDLVLNRIEGVIKALIPLDSISDETYIDIEGLNIKKAKIDSGSINITLNTLLEMPLQLNFYSPNLVPNDTIAITINGGSETLSIDLSILILKQQYLSSSNLLLLIFLQ